MSTPAGQVPWFVRIARSGAALLAGLAVLTWVTPVSVRANNGFLFGCGSPADPRGGGDLVILVCGVQMGTARAMSVAFLGAAAAVLFMSEFVTPRWRGGGHWLPGLLSVGPLAAPLITVGAISLFVEVGGTSPTGQPYRCGTATVPPGDELSSLVCGHIAQTRLALGLGCVILGLGLLVAGAYVARGFAIPTERLESPIGERVESPAADGVEPAVVDGVGSPEAGGPATDVTDPRTEA